MTTSSTQTFCLQAKCSSSIAALIMEQRGLRMSSCYCSQGLWTILNHQIIISRKKSVFFFFWLHDPFNLTFHLFVSVLQELSHRVWGLLRSWCRLWRCQASRQWLRWVRGSVHTHCWSLKMPLCFWVSGLLFKVSSLELSALFYMLHKREVFCSSNHNVKMTVKNVM